MGLQLSIILGLAICSWLSGFVLDLHFVEEAFQQAYPYVGVHAQEHAKALTSSITLIFLCLGVLTFSYHKFLFPTNLHGKKDLEAPSPNLHRYIVWTLCAIIVHGNWISNGYYFYDDLLHFHSIPDLKFGLELLFQSNGGQPYPLFFISMKALWSIFNGHPLAFNIFIFLNIFAIPIFVDQWFKEIKLNHRCGHFFFLGYLLIPQWLSYYCGGYALLPYTQITLFFAVAICFFTKYHTQQKNRYFIIGSLAALLGSASSISGLWIIPALLLWCYLLKSIHPTPSNRKTFLISTLSILATLLVVALFQYIFLTYYYTKGDTIRYDQGASFSFVHLVKNFSIILSYILSSPLISISFQGVLPAGIASNALMACNYLMAGVTLLSITVFSFKKASRTFIISLIYMLLMLLGIVFMITLGRYASDMERVMLHDKYMVMPFFFFYVVMAIFLGQCFSRSKSILYLAPIALCYVIYQHGSSKLWESIQSKPLRHSEASSRNRYTFYENHLHRSIVSLFEKDSHLVMPNLSARHIFAATAQMNGVYDIHCSDLKSFVQFRYPKLGDKIKWIETPSSFKNASPVFFESVRHSSFHQYLYCSPVYFLGHHLEGTDTVHVTAQNRGQNQLEELQVLQGETQSIDVAWGQTDFIECTLNYRPPEGEQLHHSTYSKSIDIEFMADCDFGSHKKVGIVRLSNLSMSNSVYLNPEGKYHFKISLLESTALAYSTSWKMRSLKFLTPGHYQFSFKEMNPSKTH